MFLLHYSLNTLDKDEADFLHNADWDDFNGDLEEEVTTKILVTRKIQ